jgi:hypothetical protein
MEGLPIGRGILQTVGGLRLLCGGVEPRKGAYRRDAVNQIALERDAAVVVTSEPPGWASPQIVATALPADLRRP